LVTIYRRRVHSCDYHKATLKKKSDKPICKYFRNGNCRFGIRGKGCQHDHPPLCRKLMAHGTRGPRGCSLGNDCVRFHPKMCSSSLSRQVCLNDDCGSYHIKGTRRSNSRLQDNNVSQKSQAAQNQTPNPQKNDFLDMLNSLKKDILEAMDLKIQAAQLRPQQPVQQVPQHVQGLPFQIGAHQLGRGYPILPY
jgi:hypothetical protein